MDTNLSKSEKHNQLKEKVIATAIEFWQARLEKRLKGNTCLCVEFDYAISPAPIVCGKCDACIRMRRCTTATNNLYHAARKLYEFETGTKISVRKSYQHAECINLQENLFKPSVFLRPRNVS